MRTLTKTIGTSETHMHSFNRKTFLRHRLVLQEFRISVNIWLLSICIIYTKEYLLYLLNINCREFVRHLFTCFLLQALFPSPIFQALQASMPSGASPSPYRCQFLLFSIPNHTLSAAHWGRLSHTPDLHLPLCPLLSGTDSCLLGQPWGADPVGDPHAEVGLKPQLDPRENTTRKKS